MTGVLASVQAHPLRKFLYYTRNIDTRESARLHLTVAIERAE
jgi:hypothetical protein